MPTRDLYHNQLKNALIKDGWIITDDPLRLRWGSKDMYVDLGAEQMLTAKKGTKKIAVELKTFGGVSEVNEIENTIGQYVVYRSVMIRTEQDRSLYLAVHKEIFTDIFEEPLGRILIEDYQIRLIVFDFQTEEIVKWIP